MSKKRFNLTNFKEEVIVEISSINYCELRPNYKVFVINRNGDVLHSADVHKRALNQYVAQVSKEFNVVDEDYTKFLNLMM